MKDWGKQLSCLLSFGDFFPFNMGKVLAVFLLLYMLNIGLMLNCFFFMWMTALPSYTSFLFASTLTVLTFAGMQMFKTNLASSEWMTILGGFVGSQLFVFLLTVSFAKNLKISYRILTLSTYTFFFSFV